METNGRLGRAKAVKEWDRAGYEDARLSWNLVSRRCPFWDFWLSTYDTIGSFLSETDDHNFQRLAQALSRLFLAVEVLTTIVNDFSTGFQS
jgi:hypothetical protein